MVLLMQEKSQQLTIESIRKSLTQQTQWLTLEGAIVYVCHKLLEKRTYPSRMISECPAPYEISDTICYRAINWLIQQRIITSQVEKLAEFKRGRPRRMLDITEGNRAKAEELAKLWIDVYGRSVTQTETPESLDE